MADILQKRAANNFGNFISCGRLKFFGEFSMQTRLFGRGRLALGVLFWAAPVLFISLIQHEVCSEGRTNW